MENKKKYYLLNDLLIITSSKNKVKMCLNLTDIDISKELTSDKNDNNKFSFSIDIRQDDDEEREETFTIKANDTEFYLELKTHIELCYSPVKVFGVRLSALSDRDDCKDGIPDMIRVIVELLSKVENLETEGLFRVSGNDYLLEEWKKKIDEGKLNEINFNEDIHAAAGLLKIFFRSLPEPLFTYELYYPLIKIAKNIDYDDKELKESFNEIRELLATLPTRNLILLRYICKFLNLVASYEKKKI